MVTKNAAAVLHNYQNCSPSKVKSINHVGNIYKQTLYGVLPKVGWINTLTQEDQLERIGSFNLIAALGKIE